MGSLESERPSGLPPSGGSGTTNEPLKGAVPFGDSEILMRVFKSVHEWLGECKALTAPSSDLDDIILITGSEGSGKSSLALQLGAALDPEFNLLSIGFTVSEYMDLARNMPKRRVVMSDEFLVNKRKAMRRETVDLLDFLQECRGLNLHHLICFPHADLLDKAVMDFRVRWHVHIPRRGLFQVKEKVKWYASGGVEQVSWRVVGQWFFNAPKGPLVDAYKEAKAAHMSRPRGDENEEKKALELEWDFAFLATLPGKYEQARRPKREPTL
jgi:hypothetical protein